MITIQDIKNWSKPHPLDNVIRRGGRISCFGNKEVEFSIVGGGRGLYGDFDKTFEVAIFDKESNNFVTRFFYPEVTDDVIPYMDADKVEELVNSVIKRKDLSVKRQFPSLLKLGGGCLTIPVGPKKRGFGLSFFIFENQKEF